MPSAADFSVGGTTADAIEVVYNPTRQVFRFTIIDGRITTGMPEITGVSVPHPTWLMVWLARKVAQSKISARKEI